MKTVEKQAHIRLDDQGRPWIDDANVKVIEVALDHLGYSWNPDTIQENHPHLSLAQVYAALAWYYDHQTDMDAEIARQDERIQALRDAAAPSPLQRRLAASRGGK